MDTMGVIRFGVMLALSLFPAVFACGWINNWDRPLEFECPRVNQFISDIQSIHNNHYEDRRFKMQCKKVPRNIRHCSAHCRWTGYLNAFDAPLFYDCGHNGYINGLRSYHSNHHEDRRWRIRCCKVHGLTMNYCKFTGWTNNWDGYQHYRAPTGYVTNGVFSYHDNHREDRRWKYRICKVKRCSGTESLLDILGRRTPVESQESQESEKTQESQEALESQESQENPESQESQEAPESQKSQENPESQESQENPESQESQEEAYVSK